MDTDNSSLHIVVFPWLALGHLLPFLELSKLMARRGHKITFISTPRNISRLPPIPANLTPLINLVSLPLPKVRGLRDDAEATSDLPAQDVELLKLAFDGLAAPFADFIAEEAGNKEGKPDWIVLDFAHHWLPRIASEHKIPCALFLVFPASVLAFYGPPKDLAATARSTPEQFKVPPPWIPFPTTLAYRRDDEAAWAVSGLCGKNASRLSDAERYALTTQGCSLFSPRSCLEFESEWLAILPGIVGKPVVPPGLVLLSPDETGGTDVMTWLDDQPPRSVVYIALGSEVPLPIGLVHELALGLELSGTRFLWALRKPMDMASGSHEIRLLPEGFEERTEDRGVVAMGWVPQISVLAHPSVGAFVTHCGWGSTIEGLQFGHPLVMLPVVFDQGLVAQVLEEKRVGVDVPRDMKDGSFDRHGVAKAVRRVMADDDEGRELRRNAERLREVFGDTERLDKHVDRFVEYLRSHREVV